MEYRITLLDIEVLQEGTRFPDIDKADRPIICLTFHDSYSNKYLTVVQRNDLEFKKDIRDDWIVIYFQREEDMLDFVYKFLNRLDPDLICGWNVNFDITYLKNRFKTLLNIDVDSWFEERQIFDMLQAYKRVKNIPSYSLGYVAEHEGLTQKTEVAEDIPWLYQNELERLITYNCTDVKILRELENKIGLISFYISMKEYVGVPDINDCFYFSVLLDTVLLRLAKNRNICLPSKRYDVNDEGYEGAIVFDPVPGLHRNVVVLDMAKFYPSIILTLNISPETLTDLEFSPSMDKIRVSVPDETGLVPEMVIYLKKQREMIEEQMKKFNPGMPEYEDLSRKRQVVKDLLNAVYGFLGYEKSRIYVKKLAELVTWTARQGILWAARRAEEMGYRAVYGDTDSLLIKLDEDMSLNEVIETGRELEEKITKSFDEFAKEKLGVKKHYFALEFEKVYDPVGFFPKTKKRYFARVRWEKGEECDYILIRGLEVRRTDSPEITRDMQERIIEMILYGEPRQNIIQYVRDIINKIKSGEVPLQDLGIPKGLQKPLSAYGVNGAPIPFHVRAAFYSNKYLGTRYDRGDKIKILYVKRVEGLPPSDVIAFDDSIVNRLPKITPDYDRIIEVCVRSKIEKFLEIIGCSWNEIIKQKTLSSIFNSR